MIRTKKGGHLVVISGPSGVGKSTVIAEVMHQRDNLVFSVSYTTRPPRAGEEDGVNYHFVDKAEFERMIRDGELLEYTQYAENYYGTSLADIQAFASQGLDVLLDIEVEGASNVKRKADNAVLIFVAPPSFEELSRRLHKRNTDSEDVITGRLEKARTEFREIPKYDYLVINDKVSNAVEEIEAILTAAECRVENRSQMLAQFT